MSELKTFSDLYYFLKDFGYNNFLLFGHEFVSADDIFQFIVCKKCKYAIDYYSTSIQLMNNKRLFTIINSNSLLSNKIRTCQQVLDEQTIKSIIE